MIQILWYATYASYGTHKLPTYYDIHPKETTYILSLKTNPIYSVFTCRTPNMKLAVPSSCEMLWAIPSDTIAKYCKRHQNPRRAATQISSWRHIPTLHIIDHYCIPKSLPKKFSAPSSVASTVLSLLPGATSVFRRLFLRPWERPPSGFFS